MAIALAQKGLRVHAIDSVVAMIELARSTAQEVGVADNPSFDVGDISSLALGDASFDLVIAIGVIPWLERVEPAIEEMARVTKHGGYVILTTANSAGLTSLLDPAVCPALRPLKVGVKKVLIRLGLRHAEPGMVFHSNRSIDTALRRRLLVKIRGMTRGFGFSFFRHSLLPEPFGTSVNRKLQHFANRGIPGFRSMGMASIVLARKKASSDEM